MDLVFDMQARLTEFVGEASADSTFENAGSQRAVYPQRAFDDSVTRVVWTQKGPALCVLGVHCGEPALKQTRGRGE